MPKCLFVDADKLRANILMTLFTSRAWIRYSFARSSARMFRAKPRRLIGNRVQRAHDVRRSFGGQGCAATPNHRERAGSACQRAVNRASNHGCGAAVLAEGIDNPPTWRLKHNTYDKIVQTAMPLSAGTLLGAHEFLAPIGADGMREVWKERETCRLREVYICRSYLCF